MIENVAVSVDAVRKWYPVNGMSDPSLMRLVRDQWPNLTKALYRHIRDNLSGKDLGGRLLDHWVQEEFSSYPNFVEHRGPRCSDQPPEIREKVGDLCLAMVDCYRRHLETRSVRTICTRI